MSAPPPPTDTVFVVDGGRALRGRVRVPGDKSISHRALLLAAVAEGPSHLAGLSTGQDVAATAAAVVAMGATIDTDPPTGPPTGPDNQRSVVVTGGTDRLHAPTAPLDLGNSGTTMRLIAGLLAGWPWSTELTGDPSLSARPMDRVAEPLRRMGAVVNGRGERCLPPLTIRGGNLTAIDYRPPMASAQVKSCVLLAGLRADGETVVREPIPTRAHSEELLALGGAHISLSIEDDGAGGRDHVVRLMPSTLHGFDLDVPGDPSQGAFWVVAGCIVAASELTVEHLYVGAARRGYLDVLRRMGADVDEVDVLGAAGLGASAHVTVRFSALHGTVVDAAEITGLDEVPALAVAAACAQGTTEFRNMAELRVKESDRLTGTAELVRAFGAQADIVGDDLLVTGTGHLVPGTLDAHGDHRMAMAAAVAGLAAGGSTVVNGWQAVATSYPTFADDLILLGGVAGQSAAP